jgi:hypothetical protein
MSQQQAPGNSATNTRWPSTPQIMLLGSEGVVLVINMGWRGTRDFMLCISGQRGECPMFNPLDLVIIFTNIILFYAIWDLIME